MRTFSEQMEWIRDSEPYELSEWLYEVVTGDKDCFPVGRHRLAPEELLLSIYRAEEGPDVKNRLWAALRILVDQVSWRYDSEEYIENLLVNVGYLNVTSVFNTLVSVARDGLLTRRFSRNGTPLHRYLLAAIGGLRCGPEMIPVLKREMMSASYAGLCFRALWKYRIEEAFPDAALRIVELGSEDPRFPASRLLREVFGRMDIESIWDFVKCALAGTRLSGEALNYFVGNLTDGRSNVELIIEMGELRAYRQVGETSWRACKVNGDPKWGEVCENVIAGRRTFHARGFASNPEDLGFLGDIHLYCASEQVSPHGGG